MPVHSNQMVKLGISTKLRGHNILYPTDNHNCIHMYTHVVTDTFTKPQNFVYTRMHTQICLPTLPYRSHYYVAQLMCSQLYRINISLHTSPLVFPHSCAPQTMRTNVPAHANAHLPPPTQLCPKVCGLCIYEQLHSQSISI